MASTEQSQRERESLTGALGLPTWITGARIALTLAVLIGLFGVQTCLRLRRQNARMDGYLPRQFLEDANNQSWRSAWVEPYETWLTSPAAIVVLSPAEDSPETLRLAPDELLRAEDTPEARRIYAAWKLRAEANNALKDTAFGRGLLGYPLSVLGMLLALGGGWFARDRYSRTVAMLAAALNLGALWYLVHLEVFTAVVAG